MVANSTLLAGDDWQKYFAQSQEYLPPATKLILYGLLNTPFIVVLLNILWQLVSLSC